MDYLVHQQCIGTCREVPDKTAVCDGQNSLTYRQLSERAGGIAQALRETGVRRGDRVALCLEHRVDYAASIIAVLSIGCVFVPLSLLLIREQILFIIRDAEARVLLAHPGRLELLGDVRISCPECVSVLDVDNIRESAPLEDRSPCIENDTAALMYTSGSTGMPKGVMVSHRNLVAGVRIVSQYLGLRHDDKLLGILQLSFDYGLNQLLTMLAVGGTYRFLWYRVPNTIVQALAGENITGLAGIPSIWAALMRSTLAETPLPRLRYITNSGGHVNEYLLRFLQRALPDTAIFLMYGLTEAFRSTYLPPSMVDTRPSSMGKAIPETEIFVLSEDGRLCGPGEVGELVHRGPTVSLGYWRRPEDTARCFRPMNIPGMEPSPFERIVHSGDLVTADEEGFLYYVGRNDSMIKSAAGRISPTEIESVICSSKMVSEAAAIGIGDDLMGKVVKVFLVPAPGACAEEHDFILNLDEFCKTRLPRYMVPRHYEIIDEIPRNASGKINYPVLQSMTMTT